MSPRRMAAAAATLIAVAPCAAGQPADPRLREILYDPHAVVTVPVKRGVVALIVLDPDETIQDVAAGLGSDCGKAEASWCVAAQPGGRTLFVKPKSAAADANNLAVVTDKRSHSFRFVVLAENDPKPPLYRLIIKAPPARMVVVDRAPARPTAPPAASLPAIELPSPAENLATRLKAMPEVRNSNYSLATGQGSDDILPSLIFDDGRFTYLRFAGNREVPAVFHVLGDGSETLVNARMEEDLLVIDRVSRRLMLRAGSAVIGIWNEAFDVEGRPPAHGATVDGVERVMRASATSKGTGRHE